MKDISQVKSELTYSRTMEGKWQRKANRLEKCVDCIAAKVNKECPATCPYSEK